MIRALHILELVKFIERDPAHHQRAIRYIAHMRTTKLCVDEKTFYQADERGDTDWFCQLHHGYELFKKDYQDILLKEGL